MGDTGLILHRDLQSGIDCGGQVASGDLFNTDYWCVYCGTKWSDSPRVTIWADGFGVWHARVSAHCVSPLIAARRALRDALSIHEGKVARECWLHPERVTRLDTEDTVVYREGMLAEQATCRHCGRHIVKADGIWVDPEATGDDLMWRGICDAHDTFMADHEPEGTEQ